MEIEQCPNFYTGTYKVAREWQLNTKGDKTNMKLKANPKIWNMSAMWQRIRNWKLEFITVAKSDFEYGD